MESHPGAAPPAGQRSGIQRLAGHPWFPNAQIWVALAYTTVAVIITSRAWLAPTSSWVGISGDTDEFMASLSWEAHALFNGINPFFNSNVTAPTGVNMMWDAMMPLPGLLLAPITRAFGPIVAYNIGITAALALDGWCTYLWLRRHVRDSSALLGSLLVMLGPFVAIHAPEHINMAMVFPMPLMFIAAEGVVTGTGRPRRAGVALGATTAVALLCSEEIAAIGMISTIVGTLSLAATNRGASVVPAVSRILAAGPWALATLLLIAGGPVGYQFFGPGAIHGYMHGSYEYVTDLLNVLVATPRTGPGPLAYGDAVLRWGGGVEAVEMTAFIGVPLILVTVATVSSLRRSSAFVRAAAWTTPILLLLSFGPHMHVNGNDAGVPLPGILLAYIPVLANILPVRFSLAVTFGLAALLSVAAERWLIVRRPRPLAIVAALAIAISLAPHVPFEAQVDNTPPYFVTAAINQPSGQMVMVLPLADTYETASADLWQARADFAFAMPEGWFISSDSSGKASYGAVSAVLGKPFDTIRDAGVVPSETPQARAAIRDELSRLGVKTIILGPSDRRDAYITFVDWLVGTPGVDDSGVRIWHL